jgi:hypothetical protein
MRPAYYAIILSLDVLSKQKCLSPLRTVKELLYSFQNRSKDLTIFTEVCCRPSQLWIEILKPWSSLRRDYLLRQRILPVSV